MQVVEKPVYIQKLEKQKKKWTLFAILIILLGQILLFFSLTHILKKAPVQQSILGEETFLPPATEKRLKIQRPTVITSGLDVYGKTVFHDAVSLEDGKQLLQTNPNLTANTQETVLSLQGQTGNLSLLAGTGITLNGLAIENNDPGSAQNFFKTLSINQTTNLTANANNDTLGINTTDGLTLLADTSRKNLTFSFNGLVNNSLIPLQNLSIGTLSAPWDTIYANTIYQNGSPITLSWQQIKNVLSPLQKNYDLAIGGNATASATFQIFAQTGAASAAGTLTTPGIGTTNLGRLTLGNETTGSILLAPANTTGLYVHDQGSVTIGTTSLFTNNKLTVAGNFEAIGSVKSNLQLWASGSSGGDFVSALYENYNKTGGGVAFAAKLTDSAGTGTQINSVVWHKDQAWTTDNQTKNAALTLNTFNNGLQKEVAKFASNGNVGLGNSNPSFRLDTIDNQPATVSAMITNQANTTNASVLALKAGINNPAISNKYISFLNSNGNIVGKITGNGSGGVAYSTSGGDFAEYFHKENREEIFSPGDIVCTGQEGVTKCTPGKTIIGIVSDKPGFIGEDHADDPSYILVGLIGQLAIKIQGPLKAGDAITSSSITPGVGEKAKTAGTIVGTALEDYDQTTRGKVKARINVQWSGSPYDVFPSPSFTSFPQDFPTASIAAALQVAGKTTLNDVGITGVVRAGLLKIDGLSAEINTLTNPLKLQSTATGPIEMFAGKLIIDNQGNMKTVGNITAKSITADTFTLNKQSTGVASLPSGQTTVTITSPAIQKNSNIFLTPTTLTSKQLSVVKQEQGAFTVAIMTSQKDPIIFKWLALQQEE